MPEQFSGLLHGSSPICEISEDPFRLASSSEKGDTEGTSHPAAMQLEDAELAPSGPARSSSPDPTQTVVYATVQHVSRADPAALVTPHVCAEPEGDRAVGRAHPGSKPKAELKLSRSLSKSDSDLLTCSPTEDDAMGSRSESLSNCSTGKKRLEKSPSFASEWDEIEKIMSSIGEGIDFSQEQHRISGSVPSMCLSVLAVLCTQTRCWLLCVDVFNLPWLWEGEECSDTGGADLGSHMMLNAAASNFNSTLLGKIPLILQNAAAGFSSQLFP